MTYTVSYLDGQVLVKHALLDIDDALDLAEKALLKYGNVQIDKEDE
jgi:hypothetical protein